jgi:hypothetical protein
MFSFTKWAYVLLLVSLCALASPAAELKGVVSDSQGVIIRSARIVVHWDPSGSTVGLKSNVGIEQDLRLETNKEGRFAAELPPGFYDIFVTANAFSPECRKIRIKPEEAASFNPRLKADPLVANELGDTFPH